MPGSRFVKTKRYRTISFSLSYFDYMANYVIVKINLS